MWFQEKGNGRMEGTIGEIIQKFWKEDKWDEALKMLKESLEAKESVEARYFLSLTLRRQQKFNESLSEMEKALKLMPNDIDLLSELAVCHFYCEDLNKALDILNQCVELEPENGYRYSSRAFMKERMKDFHGAIADYEKAIEVDPEDAVSLNNLGLIQERMGKMALAKRNFKKADDITKDEPVPNAKPENGQELKAEISKPIKEEPKEEKAKQEAPKEKPNKVTLKSYFNTLASLIKDKEERKAFLNFLKGKKS